MNKSTHQPTLFPQKAIPQMPAGYYTPGPNPNLRQFIADHATPYDPTVADHLAQTLPADPVRALKQIRVRKVALADFAPAKRTLE